MSAALTLQVLTEAVTSRWHDQALELGRQLGEERAARERAEAELRRKGDEALKVTLPNGIEVQTETTAEAEALMDWLMSAPELVTGAVRAAKRGPYGKHNLGPVQTKIVAALQGGPLQHRELAEATGAADRNLRYTLVSMVARGTVVRGWNQLRQVVVFALPGVELPPVPEDRPHTGKKRDDTRESPRSAPNGEIAENRSAPSRNPDKTVRAAPAAASTEIASNEGAKSEPAPRVSVPPGRYVGADLTGVTVGDFKGTEKLGGRDGLGRVQWRFECVNGCGRHRVWTAAVVSMMQKRRAQPKCECQGGIRPYSAVTGRVPMAPPPPVKRPSQARTEPQIEEAGGDRLLDEKLDELDGGSVVDDVDGLLSRAMREAESDRSRRSWGDVGGPLGRAGGRNEEDEGDEGEAPAAEQDDDDEEPVEELDFE